MINYKKRKAILHEEYALIPLGGDYGKGKFAVVDLKYKYLENYSWSLRHGYVNGSVNGTVTPMHHVIAGKPKKGNVTDHINRDKLDNRAVNLRHCSRRMNNINTIRSVRKSKYKGVSERNGKYVARIGNGGKIYLGTFKTELEAAKVYDKYAKEMYKEYATTNL